MSEIDQQFVEYVVKSLVSKPEAVKIERRIDEKGVLLELTVDPEDLGRVIGKRGATAQSLRTLLRALGTKNDARYNLKIIDNGTGGPTASDSVASASPAAASDASDTPDDAESQDEAVAAAPASDESATSAESSADETDETEEEDDGASDRLRKAREELADLDDLDV
jgi:predicted RNA-binding protein YlqC (UPF0109 family)